MPALLARRLVPLAAPMNACAAYCHASYVQYTSQIVILSRFLIIINPAVFCTLASRYVDHSVDVGVCCATVR